MSKSFLSSLLFFGQQNADEQDWAKQLKNADLSQIQQSQQMITKQDWGRDTEDTKFMEAQGEIGEEDIDFDAVEVEEIENISENQGNLSQRQNQRTKEEPQEFDSPLPIVRHHPTNLKTVEEEEIIDFDLDEEQSGGKLKESKQQEGMLPTIGFEESGEPIYKLSELVMPHTSSQKKYLMELNQRIIDTPGNLKLIDTILYPQKYYKKYQKKKQDYQRALDQQLKREEKRAEEAVARYKEKLKHRTLKESNPQLYWFTTKNPDPRVYQLLRDLRPKLVHLD